MNEIKTLLARADRYLRSANLLIKDGDYESAVSRSYYAMFFSAEALLLTKRLSFSSHKAVISAFGEHFIKKGIFVKELGKSINRAFQKRQLGDYEYNFVISKDEAKKILLEAKRFVAEIKQYINKEYPNK
ncbi:MAG: HEPN domain-containing protein [Deltaproteobacteria bacterium]|nr:HEPN domain-containing protein [Deltaproteobacteria bacterium]